MTSAPLNANLGTINLLPPSVRELAQLIGLPSALKLVERYRGRTLDIAKAKRSKGRCQLNEITELIGKEAAEKVKKRFGGTPFFFPKCVAVLRATRDNALQQRFDELTKKMSARRAVAELCSEFDLVDSTVWRILKRPSGEAAVSVMLEDENQEQLF